MTQRPKLRRFAFIRYPSQARNAGAYPLDPCRPIAGIDRPAPIYVSLSTMPRELGKTI